MKLKLKPKPRGCGADGSRNDDEGIIFCGGRG